MDLLNKIKYFGLHPGKRVFTLVWAIIICSFFTTCVDDITLRIPSSIENTVTIFGKVTRSDPSVVSVFVGRVGKVDESRTSLPQPIDGVQVMLESDDGNCIDLEPVEPPGNFFIEIPKGYPGFEIAIGKSYRISVSTPGEKLYESTFEEIIPVPEPKSVDISTSEREELNSLGNIETKNYLQFLISTPLDRPDGKGRAHLKWDFSAVYRFQTIPNPTTGFSTICYTSVNLGEGATQVFDGFETTKENLANHMILEVENNYRFNQGFQFIAYQQTLTDNAFDYWDRIRKNTNLKGNMFEAAPGKLKGNISNVGDTQEEVLGYFFASDQATFRRFVKPEEANFPRSFCGFQRYSRADEVCRNCLIRGNSTLEKPRDWGK